MADKHLLFVSRPTGYPDAAERRRDAGDHLDKGLAVPLLDRSARPAGGLDQVGNGSVADGLVEHGVGDDVAGTCAGLTRRPLDDVDLRPGARLVALAAEVLHPGVLR